MSTSTNVVAPYPHTQINVKDLSIYTPTPVETLPLFRPLIIMPAQQGVLNTPVWCSTYTDAVKKFGAETFNKLNSTYFSRASVYLNNIFQYSGAFIARVADSASAAKAYIIFELVVEDRTAIPATIPVYMEDQDGGLRTLDTNGDWIQETDDEGPVYTTGYRMYWKLRSTMTAGELAKADPLAGLEIVTSTKTETIDAVEYSIPVKTYPMFAIEAVNPGVWGNDLAFSLFFDTNANDSDVVDRCGTVFYSLAPIRKDYGLSTTAPIRDINNYTGVDFAVKPNVTDPSTTQQVSITEVMAKQYDADVPFRIVAYNANFETVGGLVMATENAGEGRSSEIPNAWYVNPLTGMHPDGRYYDTVQILTAPEAGYTGVVSMFSTTRHYLLNGADGSLTENNVETMITQFLQLSTNPTIVDRLRYPFNYLFDTGYSLALKKVMLDFMATREDVRVSVATQICANDPNDMAADLATGETLREYALLMRESVVMGTEACRASIWAHCGIPLNGNNTIVPLNLWDAIKHAQYHSLTYLNEEPAGLPNSLVECFDIDTINWIPSSEQTKSTWWNKAINYLAYANMTQIHYPAVRSVYPYDTSVLVRNVFTDGIVYLKQLVLTKWAKYADVQAPFEQIAGVIKEDLQTSIGLMFNGKYSFTVTVYRTEEEINLGYVTHVAIEITGPAVQRVWMVDIVCKREDYNEEAA